MAAKNFVRKRLFVDPKLQGALVFRIVLYWVMCLFAIAATMHCGWLFAGSVPPPDELGIFFRSAVFCTFAFLPFALIDLLRLSNRFAGPMLRLRREMQALGRGEHVEPLRFRKGDFWQEIAMDFNAVVERAQDQGNPGAPGRAGAQLASEEDVDLEAVAAGNDSR